MDVAILGYRTYPDGNVQDQAHDIVTSISKLKEEGYIDSDTHITVMGHSSGAHISTLAFCNPEFRQQVDSFVMISGVYDITKHYSFEITRGVQRFSPMAAACAIIPAKDHHTADNPSLRERWNRQSPTWLLRQHHNEAIGRCPDTLIIHGQNDVTVPMESAIRFYQSLRAITMNQDGRVDLEILPDVGHVDVITQITFGGITRDKVLNWMMQGKSNVDD